MSHLIMAESVAETPATVVYGPVNSWRFGNSLGIDPIGLVSTCSFDCVYCQLGEIEHKSRDRKIFVPTAQIIQELQEFSSWETVDIITLSGSGEPTLALNLGEILQTIKTLTHKPTLVLTNGSLLESPQVRSELALADIVSVKIDGVSSKQLQRVNRPVEGLNPSPMWTGIETFCEEYPGHLVIQTMVLSRWDEAEIQHYIQQIKQLSPDVIHLNSPTRPRPLLHQLNARGNHQPEEWNYPQQTLKPVQPEILHQLRDRIQKETHLLVLNRI